MAVHNVETIGIAGAGVMGHGIGLAAAQAGFEVIIYDPFPESLTKAEVAIEGFLQKGLARGKITPVQADETRMRLGFTTQLESLIADLIVEAAPEQLTLKHQLLSAIADCNEEDTILASNTSTIPITQIAAGLPRPAQLVGMHFFNPAPLMPLVEVIAGAASDPNALQAVIAVAEKMGKTPVQAADTPGFIVNRVARQFYLESLRILEEGGIDHPTIDTLLKQAGFKMGPFELMDLIGVETNHAVSQTLYNQFFHEPRFRPSRLQQQLVDAGHFGRKTGRGFYPYDTN